MKFPRRTILASTLLASLSLFTAPVAHAQGARTQTAAAEQVTMGAAQGAGAMKVSAAETEKAYRTDAARHIYASYPDKVYKGKMPPMVYAVVVLEMDLDATGQLRNLNMIRTPSHAPEVTKRVQEMIRQASPMPAPSRLGGAKFTEIWLVDKSGRFQLDALTEGQR
jgi:periplasmic protein TonB